jgi:hypothetical protein
VIMMMLKEETNKHKEKFALLNTLPILSRPAQAMSAIALGDKPPPLHSQPITKKKRIATMTIKAS